MTRALLGGGVTLLYVAVVCAFAYSAIRRRAREEAWRRHLDRVRSIADREEPKP